LRAWSAHRAPVGRPVVNFHRPGRSPILQQPAKEKRNGRMKLAPTRPKAG
jgi:hypothetical protein